MILPLVLALALQPKRPAYAPKTGDVYRYRYEIRRENEVSSALVGITVTKVDRGGNAQLAVTTEITSSGRERPVGAPATASFDRWLYDTGKDDLARPEWEALIRLERPGTRPKATYSFVPGDGEMAVYEVREENPNAIVRSWRRTIVLDGGRLPVSAEIRTEFDGGVAHTQTMTRLSGPSPK